MQNNKKQLEFGYRAKTRLIVRIWDFCLNPEHLAVANAVTAFLVMIFTAILTCVSVYQWTEIQNSKKDTKTLLELFTKQTAALEVTASETKKQVAAAEHNAESTRIVADASKTSANTSERALNVTIESYKQEQRAWLGARVIMSELKEDDTTITLLSANTGKTPALQVNASLSVSISASPTDYMTDKTGSTATVFPGDALTVPLKLKLNNNHLKRLLGNVITLNIQAVITYKDVFGADHTTTHKSQYSPALKMFVHAKSGNSAN